MESSEKVRIVLLVLTDTESQPDTEAAIANSLGKFYTEGLVHGFKDNGVSLSTEFVGPTLGQVLDIQQMCILHRSGTPHIDDRSTAA